MLKKNPILQIKNLVAKYDDNVILNNINFDVYEGEIFIILGSSGCGKSTLLRHMIGLNTPYSGKTIIEGIDIHDCSEFEYNKALRKIGVLFQGGALLGSMTLAQNVALPIEEYTDLSQNDIYNLVRMKLCMVNLGGYERYLPSQISGGMKKRAGLARALALSPKILFLDEPSAGLDPITSAEIDDLILHINERLGTTIVIVTHELDSIFKIGKRIIMLDKRQKGIIAEGDPRQLKETSDNPFVRQFFNRQATV